MIKYLKNFIKKLILRKGYKTNRHIVVFESDDWGSIRVPNAEILNEYKKNYPSQTLNNYQVLDCLENENDIQNLMSTLKCVKDKNGNNAKFTLNFITANPDFERIKESKLKSFFFEPITETYKQYYGKNNILNLLNYGVKNGVFDVELHSREHLNSTVWLESCLNQENCKFAFDNKMIGVSESHYSEMDTLNLTNEEDLNRLISDSCELFKKYFGLSSESFIPSCYVCDPSTEKILKAHGIKYIQSKHVRNVPDKHGKLHKKITYMGQKNALGQIYTIRNLDFETSKNYLKNDDANQVANSALRSVDELFKMKKPVVICTHRVNFVSGIDKKNAEFGNMCLKLFLQKLTQKYPDTEFMSSIELAKTISHKE